MHQPQSRSVPVPQANMPAIVSHNAIEVPEHLDAEFVRRALQNGLRKSVEVEQITFTGRSGAGDNYCSDIYRLSVKFRCDGKSRELPLVVKCVLENITSLIPTVEVAMYEEAVPALEGLFEGGGVVFSPRCYLITQQPQCTFVFEDLNSAGFRLEDRTVGLNELQAKLVLRKIAQFHAASLCLSQKDPKLFEKFPTSLVHGEGKHDTTLKEIWLGNLPYIADLLQDTPAFEGIAKKLRVLQRTLYEKLEASVAETPCMLKVLNHGDLWVNNFLFKYEAETPVDVSLIDLQVSYFGSPGVDLNYFFNTSLQLDVLQKCRYELLREYYQTLRGTLQQLKCKAIPSWEDIRTAVRRTEIFGFWAMQAFLPFMALSKEQSKDSSIALYSDKDAALRKRKAMFASERVLKTIKYSLCRFDELDVLD